MPIAYPTFSPGYLSGTTMPDTTDRLNYDALVDLLRATRAFNVVRFGPIPPMITGQDAPAAWVQPWKFRETPTSDDGDRLRRVTYRLNLLTICEEGDGSDPFDRLDQLARVAQAAIEGHPLAGCYAAETTLSEGSFPDRIIGGKTSMISFNQINPPSYTLLLIGGFEYDVPGYDRSIER